MKRAVAGKKEKFGFNQTLFLLAIILVLGCGISLVNERFLYSTNLLNLLRQCSVTGIVAVGISMVLISGGIDLSVGSIVSLVACAGARLLVGGAETWKAVLAMLLTGAACGLFNGFIISRTKCAPFIISLGSMSIFKGIALIIADGKIINMGSVFETLGRKKLWFVPMPIVVFFAIFGVVYAMLRFTVLGRRFYAMGGSEEAAYLSGVNVRGNVLLVYLLNGLVVSLAGMVLLSRLGSANATMGEGYELNSIASAVIGGIALNGGKGSLVGCFLGILLLGLISNSLNILGVLPFYQSIVLGAIIIFAVVFSSIGERKKAV
ncbi:MAG: ABC transporter permease [Clostridiales bacterium]|nr:ABC transporter permease [Clostridiales bacterium]